MLKLHHHFENSNPINFHVLSNVCNVCIARRTSKGTPSHYTLESSTIIKFRPVAVFDGRFSAAV
jgi:hypothetical protein